MPDIAELIQAGAVNAWVYLPAALLLGSLHALEPGHSKSMMAAFIIAVRGTPAQAVILGVAAAVGHTLVIWLLVLLGLWLGDQLILDKAEPWLVLVTGALIVLIALRILYRITAPTPVHHHHDHDHPHDHSHDEHGAAHATDVAKRLGGRPVSTFDIGWFGFTAGLLPCPAAFAVLLVCLQLKQIGLGVAMVAAFSVGLAITLVAVGIVAAWSARAASGRWPWLDRIVHYLPYASAAIVLAVGLLIVGRGLSELGVL